MRPAGPNVAAGTSRAFPRKFPSLGTVTYISAALAPAPSQVAVAPQSRGHRGSWMMVTGHQECLLVRADRTQPCTGYLGRGPGALLCWELGPGLPSRTTVHCWAWVGRNMSPLESVCAWGRRETSALGGGGRVSCADSS